MINPHSLLTKIIVLAMLFSGIARLPATPAQQTPQKKAGQDTDQDVVRVNTELVQTDVTVLDKRGHFVEGLRPEEFELSVGGKAQAISFFELVKTGSAREAARLATVRGSANGSGAAAPVPVNDRGRLVFFFLDDAHLSPAGITRARKALTQFVTSQMDQDDQVAVISDWKS